MRVLLDHCVARRLVSSLVGHEAPTAADNGWGHLRNGELMRAAAQARFEVLLRVDQNLRHQENLKSLPIAVLVMRVASNDIDSLRGLMPMVLAELARLQPRTFVEVPPST